jgi:hypothetical protein
MMHAPNTSTRRATNDERVGNPGAAYTAGPLLGSNPGIPAAPITARAALSATRLADGTWLFVGGTDGAVPLVSAMVFQQ